MLTAALPYHSDVRQRCDDARALVPISSLAAGSLKLIRCGREWKARCPFHADRTPSFTIYEGDSRFKCFGCGAHGDVINFLMIIEEVNLFEALDILEGGPARAAHPPRQDCRLAAKSDRRSEAVAIWAAAVPASGTLAETYLHARSIWMTPPPAIRFGNLSLGRIAPMPALIAVVTNAAGELTGIQRTYLRADGTDKATVPGGKAKLSLGAIRGGAIQLAPAGPELIVTGGLEDALTLQQELAIPAWAATGEAMMASMVLPSIVRNVIVAADNDEAGNQAAARAAEVFALQGRSARIIRPLPAYKDFNDQLRGEFR